MAELICKFTFQATFRFEFVAREFEPGFQETFRYMVMSTDGSLPGTRRDVGPRLLHFETLKRVLLNPIFGNVVL